MINISIKIQWIESVKKKDKGRLRLLALTLSLRSAVIDCRSASVPSLLLLIIVSLQLSSKLEDSFSTILHLPPTGQRIELTTDLRITSHCHRMSSIGSDTSHRFIVMHRWLMVHRCMLMERWKDKLSGKLEFPVQLVSNYQAQCTISAEYRQNIGRIAAEYQKGLDIGQIARYSALTRTRRQ